MITKPGGDCPTNVTLTSTSLEHLAELLPDWWWAVLLRSPWRETADEQRQTAEWLLRVYATVSEEAQREIVERVLHDYGEHYRRLAYSGRSLDYSPAFVANRDGAAAAVRLMCPEDPTCGVPLHLLEGIQAVQRSNDQTR